jgi:hypothetical protein
MDRSSVRGEGVEAEFLYLGVIPRPGDQGGDQQVRHAATPVGNADPQGVDVREVADAPVRLRRSPDRADHGATGRRHETQIARRFTVFPDIFPLFGLREVDLGWLPNGVGSFFYDRTEKRQRLGGVVRDGHPNGQQTAV